MIYNADVFYTNVTPPNGNGCKYFFHTFWRPPFPASPSFVAGRHYRNCCTNMAGIREPHSIKRRMYTAVVDLGAIVFVKCNLIRVYTLEKYFPWNHLRKRRSRLILLIYLATLSTYSSLRCRLFNKRTFSFTSFNCL